MKKISLQEEMREPRHWVLSDDPARLLRRKFYVSKKSSAAGGFAVSQAQKVLCTDIVDSRVSMLGITIMT